MSEMIERVAKAIGIAVGENMQASKMWNEAAKAAIEAMREPTEEMKKDQMKICIEEYKSMIDAALKE